MSIPIVITRNGQTVNCYGAWKNNSYAHVTGSFKNKDEFKDVWAGNGWPEDKPFPNGWTQVVEYLTEWANRIGLEIEELVAC